MTPEERVLGQVIASLDELAIPYMVTGSVASSHHGRPRTTHDTDIVIDPNPETLARLVARLEASGFYVDARTASEALRRRRQFNAIEMESACKVDLIVRKDRPFSHEEFGRRRPAELGGPSVACSRRQRTQSCPSWSGRRRAGSPSGRSPTWPGSST